MYIGTAYRNNGKIFLNSCPKVVAFKDFCKIYTICCTENGAIFKYPGNLKTVLTTKSLHLLSKIEKVPKGIQGENSCKDMSVWVNRSQQLEHKQVPKRGDGTWCPEG